MGVPSFYRWLIEKYPKIVVKITEDESGRRESSIDNLYLDMNGIIHPCFHPQDDDHDDVLGPTSFREVFDNIFEYVDRIFRIVRPRKLLFMAIDGVAPRAKMNQQRSRRFRTSKDKEIADKEEARLIKEFEMQGKQVIPKKESEVWDSNVITPGTRFMYELSKELQSYIRQRMEKDPAWKSIKVILSDANVPGEGEHKIMSFIRHQRSLPGYNPNTSHCLHGLDADLIMLALATHEVHFSILREDVLMEDNKKSFGKAAAGGEDLNSFPKSRGWFKQLPVLKEGMKGCCEEESSLETHRVNNKTSSVVKKPYQFLCVWVLREYLELDLKITDCPESFEADLERIIDDFIFICFFAGNDFLPHMPTLQIHEGGIDLLMHVYKEEFKNLGGYLVDMQRVQDKKGGYIKLKRVEKFILCVGTYEEKIFKKRSQLKIKALRRILAADENAQDVEEEGIQDQRFVDSKIVSDFPSCGIKLTADDSEIIQNTKEMKYKLKAYTRKKADVFKESLCNEKLRLGEPGWKKRYYAQKFSADDEEAVERIKLAVVEKYSEGLCWVLLYYFSGVPSWTWFYPFHYAPFASDLKRLSQAKVRFQKDSPFKPFDQLMGVLPPQSAHALPTSYWPLMADKCSSIIDFYPNEFEIDTDGKRYLWQGTCKLPFIEEERLIIETKKVEKGLSEDEAMRNAESEDFLFVHCSSVLGSTILSFYKRQVSIDRNIPIRINTSLSGGGVKGFLLESEDVRGCYGDVNDHDILCVSCETPPSGRVHFPRLLDGVKEPEKIITEGDIMERQLWHDYQPGSRCVNSRAYRPNLEASGSGNQSHGFVAKGAGIGWRGRGSARGCRPHDSSSREETMDTSYPAYCRGFGNLRISSSNSSNYHGRGGRYGNDEYSRSGGGNSSSWFNADRGGSQGWGRPQYSSSRADTSSNWRIGGAESSYKRSWLQKP